MDEDPHRTRKDELGRHPPPAATSWKGCHDVKDQWHETKGDEEDCQGVDGEERCGEQHDGNLRGMERRTDRDGLCVERTTKLELHSCVCATSHVHSKCESNVNSCTFVLDSPNYLVWRKTCKQNDSSFRSIGKTPSQNCIKNTSDL